MQAKSDKLLGYLLLGLGIAMILLAVYGVYNVFSGISLAAEIFQMDGITVSVPTGQGGPRSTVELLSGPVASRLINMGVWYIFMLFIVSAGGKIASIGAGLIRDIKVTVKTGGASQVMDNES